MNLVSGFSPEIFGAGFALSFGLIVAIGAQNAYVLRLGLQRHYVFLAALFCSVSDLVLMSIGAAGVGSLVSASRSIFVYVALAGAAFLVWYGFLAARRALKSEALESASGGEPQGFWAVVGTLVAMTYLNPHCYLDTVVLVGSISGRYPPDLRVWFVVGAALASLGWFFSLAYGARLLAPLFARPLAWKILDGLIALVMWSIAWSLVHEIWTAN